MDNANLPAMPQDYVLWCDGIGNCPTKGSGLTKREYLAAMAMQGILSGLNGDARIHESSTEWKDDVVGSSVIFADAQLAELEKPNANS